LELILVELEIISFLFMQQVLLFSLAQADTPASDEVLNYSWATTKKTILNLDTLRELSIIIHQICSLAGG